jgi:phosphatidylserine/phosphatidylglycerophosphate/cardiolipin synthase-like enzyme
MDDLQVTFLEMDKQPATEVAQQLAAFLGQARRSLDIAVYNFHLVDEARTIIEDALRDRAAQGVTIRLVYDSDTDWEKIAPGNSAPPSETVAFIKSLGYPAQRIADPCCLMHHKYIVLDAGTPEAQVWTGSTNFTDESWALQENNIVTIRSQRVAAAYAQDFQELWRTGTMTDTGKRDVDPLPLTYQGQRVRAEVHFSPGQGKFINRDIAERIQQVRERITICAAVITSGSILNALMQAQQHNVPIDGVYDRTQMEGVFQQWDEVESNAWKIPAFHDLVEYSHLVGKVTTPWTPTSVHDFMHNKIIVVDDTVITGSHNFSRNAETNAENVLMLTSPQIASDYRAYIRHLAQRYGPQPDQRGQARQH